jgi:Zn-dependent protease with chaperone function
LFQAPLIRYIGSAASHNMQRHKRSGGMMKSLYPAGPISVPGDLTRPTAAYRRHAWLASGGLALFVILYFALAGWFGWTAYRLFGALAAGDSDGWFVSLIGGACAGFLCIFMLKALVFVKPGQAAEDLEVTAETQPRVFEFLYRLADEAGAPRPHRVFLSGSVNAAVFYDLSILNLLLPSKKNLEIGLGLVNILTLSEFKAVLAHEFGHFAQRTMAVGRWVYIAQQIAGHIVSRRDALDTLLAKLSRVDIRIAWIGWLLRLIVWAIRSLVEIVFRLVVLSERALSREMELQADLVAVSLTGSDALIHALHRLAAADDAWDRAIAFANREIANGHGVKDLFLLQSQIIEKMRGVLGDPAYGAVPEVPDVHPEAHRIFKAQLASPPRMWSSHPPNADRETNAKRTYVPAPFEQRSAWDVFDNVQEVREQVTAHLARAAEVAPARIDESLKRLDAQYEHDYLHRRYRGAYLGRRIGQHAESVEELIGEVPPADDVLQDLDTLYPPELGTSLDRLRVLEEEWQLLKGLEVGVLRAAGSVIQHRGEEIRHRDLPQVIARVQGEIDEARAAIHAQDRRCRATHIAAAEILGQGWSAYLRGLVAALHYAEHSEANLLDAQGLLANTWAVVVADDRISASERQRLLAAAWDLFKPLSSVHEQAPALVLDESLLVRLDLPDWAAAVGKLKLPAPSEDNLSDWLSACDGWVNGTVGALSALRMAALEQLLVAEREVAQVLRSGQPARPAPKPSVMPATYGTLVPGRERKRQTKLDWWDRFQTADGFVASAARVAVAGAIVGSVVYFGTSVGLSTIWVYNGLARQVAVEVGDHRVAVPPFSHTEVTVPEDAHYEVRARTAEGQLIEEFETDTKGAFTDYVYNVAAAGALVEWHATYGKAREIPERLLGAPRWSSTQVDFVFEDPPESISSKSGNGTRSVLTGLAAESPDRILSALESEAERDAMIVVHARWDASTARYTAEWSYAALESTAAAEIVAGRLRDEPGDAFNLRLEQDLAGVSGREVVCRRHRDLAVRSATNPDLQYVAARCLEDWADRDQAFLRLQKQWPDHPWLLQAAGYVRAGRGEWVAALELLERAQSALPGMAEKNAVEVARLRRMTTVEGKADLADLMEMSEALSVRYALETGEGLDGGPYLAYAHLAKGELGEALAAAGGEVADDRFVRLAAASEGAQSVLIQRALALGTDAGIDPGTIWSALALAVRERHITADHTAQVVAFEGGAAEQMLRAFEGIRTGGNVGDVEAELVGLSLVQRGQLYAAAVVMLGRDCPPVWRDAAKRLLFASERPYFT